MSKLNSMVVILCAFALFVPGTLPAQGPQGKILDIKGGEAKKAEQKIRAALDKKVELKFVETPLQDVVDFLAKTADINIQLDTRALDTVGIGSDTPITRNVKGVSLRSAIRLSLRDLELTYMFKNEVLMITTPEEAEAQLDTKVYEVRDLVLPPTSAKTLVYSPASNLADFDSLIEVITTTVAPESWDEVGGPGSIEGYSFAGKYVLIVSQTEDVHEPIADLLQVLREVEPNEAEKKKVAKVADLEKSDVFVRVYPLTGFGSDDAGEVAELIREATGKNVWSDDKGTFVSGKARAIVVKHNQEIHDQVYELLVGIEAIDAIGDSLGFVGGKGNSTAPNKGGFF